MGNAAEDQEAVTFLGKEFSVARLFAKTNFFFLYGGKCLTTIYLLYAAC